MKKKYEFRTIDEIFHVYNGSTPSKSNPSFWNSDDVNWFTIEDIRLQGRVINKTKQFISQEGFASCSLKLLPKQTILICCTASVGEYAITNVELCTNQQFNGLVIKEMFDDLVLPKYIFHYCATLKKELLSLSGKTTIDFVSMKKLKSIKIPIPPLEEQQKIVEKLDKAFELIDRAKANIEQNIINAKELFQSKLDVVFSVKNGNVFKLGDLGKITSSKRIYKNEYVNEGIPFYRTKEIKELANSEEISLELFISREKYYEIKSKFGVPKIGDILISAVGTIGEIYVIDDSNEFYFKDGNIIWLKGFNNINSHYLKYLLKSIVNDIKKLAHGSAYSALTIEKLVNVEVNLPDSLNVQEEIVKVLDETASLTDSLISKYLEKLSNLEELRKSILEKAFKGELTN